MKIDRYDNGEMVVKIGYFDYEKELGYGLWLERFCSGDKCWWVALAVLGKMGFRFFISPKFTR